MKLPGAIGLLVLIAGCSEPAPKAKKTADGKTVIVNADSTVQFTLEQLHYRLLVDGSNDAKLDRSSNAIMLSDTVIRIKPKVEFNGQKQGQWIYATNFKTELNIGKQQELDLGVIGVGSTSRQAFEVCVSEWMNTFGIPLSNLLNRKETLVVSGLKIYPGLMGIKGNAPPNSWLTGDKTMSQKIISKILPLLRANNNQLISVDIKVLINAAGLADGECRINNFVSYELLEALQQLRWPATNEKLIFSQFYLVQKR